jgi:1-deoxy-D-xylulose-5-phosphate synthase
MSIAENHGGLYENLRALRESNGECECNLFKAMNLDYKYVAEGNDIDKLISAFESVKDSDKPVVLHICTQKGKGYALAEQNKENWHWCMPFDAKTGKSKFDFSDYEDYSAITVNYLLDKMQEDKSVVAITSATPAVFGFTKENRDKAGKQFVDVGIAEEHAVALASGIAKNGGKPVYGVYSTFLQRTYDQLSQDVCINNSAVTFLVFSASVYGMNDVTHLGIYDIPMISNIPNMVYLAPTSKEEYLAMTKWAIDQTDHPVAIRVPSNGVISSNRTVRSDYSELNRFEMVEKGGKVAVVALGDFYQLGEQVAEKIKSELSIDATLINPIFATGIDEEMLDSLKADHEVVVTLEDGMIDGGFGEKIARYYGNSDVKVLSFGLKKEFPDRYDLAEYLKENKLTPEQIVAEIKALV